MRSSKITYSFIHYLRAIVYVSGEKKHPCPICAKPFARTDHLKKHMLVHDPNRVRNTSRRHAGAVPPPLYDNMEQVDDVIPPPLYDNLPEGGA